MYGGREIRSNNLPRRIESSIDPVDGGFVGIVKHPNGCKSSVSPVLTSHAEAVIWCAKEAQAWGYRT